MKKTLLTIGLATVFATTLFAAETLSLRLEPDRDVILKGSPQEVVVKIDLTAVADKTKATRTPLNLAVVLDRSGSMTGAKLEKAKQAATQLVDHLESGDIFSLITYSDEARVVVPAQRVESKAKLKARIAEIEAGGSTALYAGVKTGADQVQEYFSSKRINRVILLSDGLANIGPSTPRDPRRFGHDLSERGLAVTTIGVGDDYNEDLMAGLAEASDANYYYVKDTEKLPQIFAKELGELLTVAARDVRIEIICPNGVKPIGFIGRSEKFEDQKATVRLSHFVAGQDRYVFLRCLVSEGQPEIARVKVGYVDELAGGSEQSASSTVKIRFTEDRAIAERSVNVTINAQKELMLTAVAKDEAMAEADAGHYKQAAARLNAQANALNNTMASAPAAVQVQIRGELDNLTVFTNQLQQGQYNFRKDMQSQSYNTRNSKQ